MLCVCVLYIPWGCAEHRVAYEATLTSISEYTIPKNTRSLTNCTNTNFRNSELWLIRRITSSRQCILCQCQLQQISFCSLNCTSMHLFYYSLSNVHGKLHFSRTSKWKHSVTKMAEYRRMPHTHNISIIMWQWWQIYSLIFATHPDAMKKERRDVERRDKIDWLNQYMVATVSVVRPTERL